MCLVGRRFLIGQQVTITAPRSRAYLPVVVSRDGVRRPTLVCSLLYCMFIFSFFLNSFFGETELNILAFRRFSSSFVCSLFGILHSSFAYVPSTRASYSNL